MFNRIDWLQVWQPSNPGKERRLFLRNGRGNFVITGNAWTAQAARTGKNQFELVTRNVATLRLYVNDQMANFAEPVRVTVNKKVQFEGKVTPSAAEMLKDQLFLGRGWRYFTGVIEIDLAPPPATTETPKPPTQRPPTPKSPPKP